jgi:hypothetical protein
MTNPASRIVKTKAIKAVVVHWDVRVTEINIPHICMLAPVNTLDIPQQSDACLPSGIPQSWDNRMKTSPDHCGVQ